MNYKNVQIESLGYELAPVVVSSEELEERLASLYKQRGMPIGQLESLTGIGERRWWEENTPLSQGAAAAGRKAIANSNVTPSDIGTVIYAGVNRENFEPATACRVASELGIKGAKSIYDISNACLGVLNGIFEIANQIELGQIRAGLVTSCETAREINDIMIERMLEDTSMEMYAKSVATLTGGSGAAAVLLTDGSFGTQGHKLLGGVIHAAPEHHELCYWGLSPEPGDTLGVPTELHGIVREVMVTDAVSVLKHGVQLGAETWEGLLTELNWTPDTVNKVICHQVGKANRDTILGTIGIPQEKDFSSFEYLGNMGTVSVPLTAALAHERGFLEKGDQVAFLGIGSGLNCMMLGFSW
jgi:3-oxoacyl-[acyl-carrier-protein] synthase-3